MIGLLAFLLFGLIGILLSAAMFLEHSKRKHSASSQSDHSEEGAAPVTSGVAPALHPKV
jgi:hypothetical protein